MYTYEHELRYLCTCACITYKDAHQHTQTCTQAHIHKCIQTCTDTYMHAHKPVTNTQIQRHAHTHAEMYTHTHVQRCTHIKPHSYAVISRLTQRYTQTQAHTHMNTGSTCARTHKDTYAYHTPSQEEAYTLAGYTDTHMQTRSRRHVRERRRSNGASARGGSLSEVPRGAHIFAAQEGS